MQSNSRSNRKERTGIVVSDKMDKTITVQVERVMHHSVYNKSIKRSTKFKAHDEKNTAKTGDVVIIQETRPLSKTKRWRLVEVVKRSAGTKASEPEKTGAENKQG